MNTQKYWLLLIIILLPAQNLFAQGDFIRSYAKKHDFSGTIFVKKKSRIAYAESFGSANRQFHVPNKIDTKFKVASITKAFTSVLVLQLFEQGKIDLARKIKTYLPNYKGEAGEKVSVHQLLNHTAGIANLDRHLTSAEAAVKNGLPHYQTPLTSDELLDKFCSERLVGVPGTAFDYNNADYIILGKIVEHIHGKPFEQILREKILQPLGMKNSGMLSQDAILDNLADTYFFRPDRQRLSNDLPVFIENWYAAGAMYSTVADLVKFSDALFGQKLVGREALNLMLTPGLDDYGYGVWIYETVINDKKYRVVKRPGRIMGAQSMLFRVPDENLTIVILSNTDSTGLDEFAAEISRRMITGK